MAPSRSPKAVKAERDQKLNAKIQSLKRNMAKICMDQQRIREGQRNVRQRFASVKQECNQLRQETNVILKQAILTKIKLALMFQILRTRKDGTFPMLLALLMFFDFFALLINSEPKI